MEKRNARLARAHGQVTEGTQGQLFECEILNTNEGSPEELRALFAAHRSRSTARYAAERKKKSVDNF